MSKSISPRLKNPDWDALMAQAREFDRPLNAEELSLWKRGVIDGNQRIYAVEYVDACHRAIEGLDPNDMVEMLRHEIPPPPFLLPVIAHFIATKEQGLLSGRASKMTILQRNNLKEAYRWKLENHLIESVRDFDARIAAEIEKVIGATFSTADLRRVRYSRGYRLSVARALQCDESHLLQYVTKTTQAPSEWIDDMAAVFGVSSKTIRRYLNHD